MYSAVKIPFDLVGAGLGLLVAGPVILLSALLIWLEDRSASPFIHQARLGRNEQPFGLVKLRTMRTERYRDGRKLTDAERLLWLGKWFRKFSIDELPQLVNVIRGQMSFIGPRPMPVAYQPYFRPEEHLRHSVRPGMSGPRPGQREKLPDLGSEVRARPRVCAPLRSLAGSENLLADPLEAACLLRRGNTGPDLATQSLYEVREPWTDIEQRCDQAS